MKKKTLIEILVISLLVILALLYFVPVRLNVWTVTEVYQYEDLLPENLLIEAQSLLHKNYVVNEYELSQTDMNGLINTAHVEKYYLKRDFDVKVCPMINHTASYEEAEMYAGKDLDRSKIHVYFEYQDGRIVEKEKFTMPDNPMYITGEDYRIVTKIDDIELECLLSIATIPIDYVTPHAKYGWFSDDDVYPDSYTMHFADGAECEVEKEEVIITSEDLIIQNGDNVFEIEYHNLPYEICVFGVEKLLVGVEVVEKEAYYIDLPIPYEKLGFLMHFEDETTVEMEKFDRRITVEEEDRLLDYGENQFQAYYKDQPFEFLVHAIEKEIEEIEPIVEEAYIGETLKLSKIVVNYTDKTSIEKTDFEVNQDIILTYGENDCEILYHDNTYHFTIKSSYRPIVAARVAQPADLLEGDVLTVSEIGIVYDNGTKEVIPTSDVTIISDLTMVAGENNIFFHYHEQDVSFPITAFPRTSARLAKRTYAAEYAAASYRHVSDNIYAVSTKGTTETGIFWLTHVIINDPSQIHGGLSNDTFGGDRERPTKASKRMGWVVGTNGSYFVYDGGLPALAGVFIKNGQHISGSRTNGSEVCLKSDGTLCSMPSGLSPTDLINQGVVQTWGTGLPPLIENGVSQAKAPTTNVKDRGMSSDYNVSYPRTAYGMVKPCEYYIVTAGEKSYENGLTLSELIAIFQSRGCVYARCVDGGGSSSLVFENKLVNVPCPKGSERAVADFIYFTE